MILIQLKDIPYFLSICLGIFLPEIYLHTQWTFKTLAGVRLLTLLLTCVLATWIDHVAYPAVDPGTLFVRAFIYISMCRMIILSSHDVTLQRLQSNKADNDK